MRLAVWQTQHKHNVTEALAALDQAVQTLDGVDLLVMPEMMLGGYHIGQAAIATLAKESDKIETALSHIAQKNQVALVAGKAVPDGGRVYNAAVVFDKTGQRVATYYKTHLFGDVDRGQFARGPALPPVVDLNGWRIGLAICYDIEFPETARHLADAGADVIVVPTANMLEYDSVPLRMVPTRAEENAVMIAYANATGAEGAFTYGGLSCICGADGNDLARAGRGQEMLIADLSKSDLHGIQRHLTHRADRRSDLYPTKGTPQ